MSQRELVESWKITLQTERKSKKTLDQYLGAARRYYNWCATNGHPEKLDKRQVQLWIVELDEAGREGETLKAYQGSLRRFAAWLVEEGELETDPLAGMKAPKLDEKVVNPLTVEEVQALIKTCDRKTFTGVRDEAIIRLLNETIARAGEIANMMIGDIDIPEMSGVIRRGKGGKGRPISYGPKTAQALDRYARARRNRRQASSPHFWIGDRSPSFSYFALYRALKKRAEIAGIKDFHPHRTRHTGATRWLESGGSEGGLMAITGWSNRKMVDRYTKATAQARAAAEAQRINLGEI